MTKKEVEIREEELKNNFKAFPRLADYFINVEYFIRNFGRYRWKEGTTREKLRLEADTLMETAKNMDSIDLKIIYYLNNSCGVSKNELLHILKQAKKTRCETLNAVYATNEYVDPLDVGWILFR